MKEDGKLNKEQGKKHHKNPKKEEGLPPIDIDNGKLAIAFLALGILAAIFMWFVKGAKTVALHSKRLKLAQLKKEESELASTLKYLKWKKERLEKQYEKAYRLLRFLAFIVWLLLQTVLAAFFCELDAAEILGFLTDVNAYSLIIIGFIHYIKFGTLTNYLRYLVRFRTWIKNYVFRNHLHIDQDIFDCDQQRRTIISRLETLNEEIKELEHDLSKTK